MPGSPLPLIGRTLFLLLATHWSLQAQEPPKRLVEGYRPRTLVGWEVHVSEQLLEEKSQQTEKALRLLAEQLETICEVVPEKATQRLQNVRIWVSPTYPGTRPKAEYHPSKQWLVANDRLEVLAKCVEITNVDIFEKECLRMPMLALHELAHAYHDQVLDFDNSEIEALYLKAKDAGLYERVERWHGPDRRNTYERAYAMSNAKEYFAECSEAFFGRNDFFPFESNQLERHDPAMFALLKKLWSSE